MSRRTRYQQGSVQREKRLSGSDVWIYRWYETGTDGTSKYRKAIVGTVATLANETSALKAAQALRIDANQQAPHAESGPRSVAELIAHKNSVIGRNICRSVGGQAVAMIAAEVGMLDPDTGRAIQFHSASAIVLKL